MNQEGPVFLIGYMGAGKTTIGRLLAVALGKSFLDLDDLIEARTGKAIPVIFETEGETGFRSYEQAALYSLKGRSALVVATGGGCPVFEDNMDWMNNHGTTLYLRCHPGYLFHRIAPEKKRRPLIAALEDVDIMEFILESLKKRLPYYTKADLTLHGENSPEEVVKEILDKLPR